MTSLFGAYVAGGAVGLAAGAFAAVVAVTWVAERMDQATTLPAPAKPSARVIDLAGRRSTRSWSA